MRSVVYRFEDLTALKSALEGAPRELELPGGDPIGDGEWVLAIFEIGAGRRATASAARGAARDGRPYVRFEDRDWERILDFANGGGQSIPPRMGEDEELAPTTIPSPSAHADSVPIPLINPPKSTERYPFVTRGQSEPVSNLLAADTLRPPAPISGSHAAPTFPQGAHVLVVDDDPAIGDMVAAMLEAVGLIVDTANSAEEALRLVQDTPFDLVVLDWSLPGMSGLELCRSIRRESATATLPVLFLSAHSSTADIVDAFASGADDFVIKPFRAPELGARIFALLRRARMSGA